MAERISSSRASSSRAGKAAEQAAAEFLIAKGYRILARNYNVHGVGELDLVAERQGRLTVVEVKARRNTVCFGGPEAAITNGKLKKIRKTTLCYLKENGMMNIDVSILALLIKINSKEEFEILSIIPIEWR